jgi:hypothetical protein
LQFQTGSFGRQNAELNIKERHLYFKYRNKQEELKMKQAAFTKSFTVALRPDAYDQIKAITDEEEISMADWVRTAVDVALSELKPKEDTM